ncbi:MAG: 50S ribosomal protein L23 [Proteobacteria bacterium]|nr:50S ribosomal protein L23 [Pseudomonadota bacterium]
MTKYLASKANKPSKERMYELIRKPIITEKATLMSEFNQVSFYVPLDADKFEIRSAIEDLFKVKVTAVNTLRQQGKIKKFRNVPGRRNETKKAVITLAEGHTIDVTTAL